MTSPRNPLAIFAIASMLLVAGCGGSDDSSTSGGAYGGGETTATEQPASSATETGGATVSAASVPKLGKLIVDAQGFTLYNFHKDKGTTSSCYEACAEFWPPLTTEGSPKAEGVPAGMLGTTKRKDGTVQVTFAGHPLYTFKEDEKPGEANGNDLKAFGDEWYALQPNGEEPED
jgi:predicted lipoprotein with Yx(FWY)xxD motif